MSAKQLMIDYAVALSKQYNRIDDTYAHVLYDEFCKTCVDITFLNWIVYLRDFFNFKCKVEKQLDEMKQIYQ